MKLEEQSNNFWGNDNDPKMHQEGVPKPEQIPEPYPEKVDPKIIPPFPIQPKETPKPEENPITPHKEPVTVPDEEEVFA